MKELLIFTIQDNKIKSLNKLIKKRKNSNNLKICLSILKLITKTKLEALISISKINKYGNKKNKKE